MSELEANFKPARPRRSLRRPIIYAFIVVAAGIGMYIWTSEKQEDERQMVDAQVRLLVAAAGRGEPTHPGAAVIDTSIADSVLEQLRDIEMNALTLLIDDPEESPQGRIYPVTIEVDQQPRVLLRAVVDHDRDQVVIVGYRRIVDEP